MAIHMYADRERSVDVLVCLDVGLVLHQLGDEKEETWKNVRSEG